jgi:tripartite-type tricarboxylate transporter receptor subunit TctC
VPGIEVYSWQAFVAPKGLPQNVKDRLQPALIAAIRHPDVVKRFNELGFEVVATRRRNSRHSSTRSSRAGSRCRRGGIKQTD